MGAFTQVFARKCRQVTGERCPSENPEVGGAFPVEVNLQFSDIECDCKRACGLGVIKGLPENDA